LELKFGLRHSRRVAKAVRKGTAFPHIRAASRNFRVLSEPENPGGKPHFSPVEM
jgi:hypothetical protein